MSTGPKSPGARALPAPELVRMWVSRAQAGDLAAAEALIRLHRPRIYALAFQLLGRASDAEDATQEACLRIWQNLPGFEGRCEFFTWVYQVALNQAREVRRRRTRVARYQSETSEDPRLEMALWVDGGQDPEAQALMREDYSRLIAALDEMSEVLSSTVILVAIHGLTHAHVAQILETNEGTISWRIHEARRILKKALEEPKRFRVGATQKCSQSALYRLSALLANTLDI